MISGFDSFKKWFADYNDQFVVIGGVASDILLREDGRNFRETKDIDMVLLIEALTVEFGSRFWEYVREGGYQRKNKSGNEPQFYRFSEPDKSGFPYMIELFSRRLDSVYLPTDAVLTPLPLDDDISSLSAILMDDDYYSFLLNGRIVIDSVPVLDTAHLIPFKAKAWLDLVVKKSSGKMIDSRDIRKHKNDVFRLSQLLRSPQRIEISSVVKADMIDFCNAMDKEDLDAKAIGIPLSKEDMLRQIRSVYLI
jgi:hypothetical protein